MSWLSSKDGEVKTKAGNSPTADKVWMLGRVPIDIDIYERELARGRLTPHDDALVFEHVAPGPIYTPYYGLIIGLAGPLFYGRRMARPRWSNRRTFGLTLAGGSFGFALGLLAVAGATFVPMMQLSDGDTVREVMDDIVAEQEKKREMQQAGPAIVLEPSSRSAPKSGDIKILESVPSPSSLQDQNWRHRFNDFVKRYLGGTGGGKG